jgi:hypothetical protein
MCITPYVFRLKYLSAKYLHSSISSQVSLSMASDLYHRVPAVFDNRIDAHGMAQYEYPAEYRPWHDALWRTPAEYRHGNIALCTCPTERACGRPCLIRVSNGNIGGGTSCYERYGRVCQLDSMHKYREGTPCNCLGHPIQSNRDHRIRMARIEKGSYGETLRALPVPMT